MLSGKMIGQVPGEEEGALFSFPLFAGEKEETLPAAMKQPKIRAIIVMDLSILTQISAAPLAWTKCTSFFKTLVFKRLPL